MPPSYQSHPATRVLDYLERCERRADLDCNRFAAIHYKGVWAFVFDHTFGGIPQPWIHTPKLDYVDVPVLRKKTGYQIEMLKRPMRKIVRRVESVRKAAGGRLQETYIIEVLDCGHRLPERQRWFDETPAKRRRCADCATPARAVAVEVAQRARA